MNCTVCGKKLRSHNKIGTCRKHRGLSPVRRQYENEWQQENKSQYQASKNKWVRDNPEYYKSYRDDNMSNKIAHSLRTRLRKAIKFGSAIENLGCLIPELLAHLESKFVEGMNWSNYGDWHIDHIKPLVSYDLTNPEQLIQACNFNNLQPLWAAENQSKHAKLDYVPKSAPQAKKSA